MRIKTLNMKFSKEEEVMLKNFFLLKEKKQFKKALEVLDILSVKHKNNSVIYGLSGSIFYELKDFKKSQLNFNKVLSIKPKSELASLGLFQSLVYLGEDRKALKELFRYTEMGGKPKLYLTTIKELMEKKNLDGIEFKTDKKTVQDLYKKWCL